MAWMRSFSAAGRSTCGLGRNPALPLGLAVLLLFAILASHGRVTGVFITLLVAGPALALAVALLHGPGQVLLGPPGTGRWAGAVGLVTGSLAFAILLPTEDHSWVASLLAAPAAGLWVWSSLLGASERRRLFVLAPLPALGALLFLAAVGYARGAGILFFVGPPVALCLTLAGHYLAGSPGYSTVAGQAYLSRAYLAATMAVSLFAWLDLL